MQNTNTNQKTNAKRGCFPDLAIPAMQNITTTNKTKTPIKPTKTNAKKEQLQQTW